MTALDNIFNQILNQIDNLDLKIVELALQNASITPGKKKK